MCFDQRFAFQKNWAVLRSAKTTDYSTAVTFMHLWEVTQWTTTTTKNKTSNTSFFTIKAQWWAGQWLVICLNTSHMKRMLTIEAVQKVHHVFTTIHTEQYNRGCPIVERLTFLKFILKYALYRAYLQRSIRTTLRKKRNSKILRIKS